MDCWLRIGVDVGGTNTDAVLMHGHRVLAEVKTPTTADVASGIRNALHTLLGQAAVEPKAVHAVMVGTTQFTNAIVVGKDLVPVAVVRLGLPATHALPPMVDWPPHLYHLLGAHVYLCHSGCEFDGRPLSPVDAGELRRVAADIAAKGLRSIAICSVFSSVNDEPEQQAAEIFAAELPGIAITRSGEIGRIGLRERENATIINACLRDLATRIVTALRTAVFQLGITGRVWLSQNDGMLMSIGTAGHYPVTTFACGPTNSMRGAAFLSGRQDCVVVDIGGTTTDVGVLCHGFPRQACGTVRIGGVRTNFRMPDVYSFGLGGGSVVRDRNGLTIGPDSVGYELTRRALVFGGDAWTATDLAVAGGLAELGDPLPGVSELVKPAHFAVANAIGAAIAQVGGEVDRIFSLQGCSREHVLGQATQQAVEKAIAAGAAPASIEIVDVEEVPLSYLPGNATRIRVKAVGDLRFGADDHPAPRREPA